MNITEYNEVINGEDTFKTIAQNLKEKGSCLIGWTDEKYEHRDILFTYNTKQYGTIQRGIKGWYLFVSIMSMSCIGFLPTDTKENGYILEKLQLSDNPCNQKICDLINGVIKKLNEE